MARMREVEAEAGLTPSVKPEAAAATGDAGTDEPVAEEAAAVPPVAVAPIEETVRLPLRAHAPKGADDAWTSWHPLHCRRGGAYSGKRQQHDAIALGLHTTTRIPF